MDAYLKIAMEIKDNMAKVFKAHRSITSRCLLGVLEEKLCKIVDYSLTTDAILTNDMHSDGEKRCDIWTNEDESAEIERQIVEDKEKENAAEWTFQMNCEFAEITVYHVTLPGEHTVYYDNDINILMEMIADADFDSGYTVIKEKMRATTYHTMPEFMGF